MEFKSQEKWRVQQKFNLTNKQIDTVFKNIKKRHPLEVWIQKRIASNGEKVEYIKLECIEWLNEVYFNKDKYYLDAIAMDIKALMDEPSGVTGKIAVVAEIDGIVASYIGASYILDECEIGNVCTHPDYRRQGAAEAVLRELISRCVALNIQSIFLEVSSTNDGAIALYKKLGFTQYNMRADYYGKGDDALLFVYKIF